MKRQLLISITIVGITTLVIAACAVAPGPQPNSAPIPASVDKADAAAGTDVQSASALLPASLPPFPTSGWTTDFARSTVPWDEILSGGPPKDGIPAIDAPTFESVDSAHTWLSGQDPVIAFQAQGDVRAYPLAILVWHEIVNDTVGNQPVAVTFCPLCNASIVFKRDFAGEVLNFGTTGKLRNSDLIMYDRQSESWWQQFTGQGIVGKHAGAQLDFLPSQVISFSDFAAEFPEGLVLARPPLGRSYGTNPYAGYDGTQRPFLFQGEVDDRLPATERVAGIALGGGVKAYPFTQVAATGAINDAVAGVPLVVFHKPGTASALDADAIRDGRDVGSVAVFDRRIDAQTLTFTAMGEGTYSDVETGSTWNILGKAVTGELAGEQLSQILAFDHFWFAWAAFHPETALYGVQ